jgi:hypothetical protein
MPRSRRGRACLGRRGECISGLSICRHALPLSSSSIASANENGVNRNGDALGGTIRPNVRRMRLHGFGYAFRKTGHTQRYSAYAYEEWVRRNNGINFKAIRKRSQVHLSSEAGAGENRPLERWGHFRRLNLSGSCPRKC